MLPIHNAKGYLLHI